jgi:hypothetical protein
MKVPISNEESAMTPPSCCLKSFELRRLQNLHPITDPRIIALVNSHPPGGGVICVMAHTENPGRQVSVVYGRDRIAAITDPLMRKPQTFAQLESALADAGIVYAVVEQDEMRAFIRQLDDAFSLAALKKPDRCVRAPNAA